MKYSAGSVSIMYSTHLRRITSNYIVWCTMLMMGDWISLADPISFQTFTKTAQVINPYMIRDFGTLTIEDLTWLPSDALNYIAPITFRTFNAPMLHILDAEVISALSSDQLSQMDSDQIEFVHPELRSILPCPPYTRPYLIEKFILVYDFLLEYAWILDEIKISMKWGIAAKFAIVYTFTLVVEICKKFVSYFLSWLEHTVMKGLKDLKSALCSSTLFKGFRKILDLLINFIHCLLAYMARFHKFLKTSHHVIIDIFKWIITVGGEHTWNAIKQVAKMNFVWSTWSAITGMLTL